MLTDPRPRPPDEDDGDDDFEDDEEDGGIPAWKMEVGVYGWLVPVLRFWAEPVFSLAD
jgi:hypothetical protein